MLIKGGADQPDAICDVKNGNWRFHSTSPLLPRILSSSNVTLGAAEASHQKIAIVFSCIFLQIKPEVLLVEYHLYETNCAS